MLTMCKVAARGGGSQKQTCCNIKRNFNVADIIVWILIYLSVPCCVSLLLGAIVLIGMKYEL